MRRLRRCVAGFALVTLLLIGMVAAPVAGRPLTVTFYDVGEADAVCIRTPGGKTILIDGGSDPYTVDEKTVPSKPVGPLLARDGITRIDAIVVSHAHGDHVSGLISVVQSLPVAAVYDAGYSTDDDQGYRQFRELVEQRNIPWYRLHPGDTLDWGGNVTAVVFGPPESVFSGSNNNSLIIKVQCGPVSFLFAGDTEKDEEEWAVRTYGRRLEADVLKAAHHGSGTSSSKLFLRTIHPRYAVISCGLDNPFGHPHSQTLLKLRKRGVRLLRTDYDGDIVMQAHGAAITVKTANKMH